MERWVGKVAVVTGASAGIGAAVAELFVREGLQVVGIARRNERVEELAKKLQAEKGKLYSLKVDVSKENEVVEAFKWVKENVGPVHILVNNAGVTRNTNLTDGDYQKWKEIVDTNILALCLATREAVRSMKENNIDGHIIHINSVLGHVIPYVQRPRHLYPPSKYAVTALTETLRQEFNNSKLKIKVTSISPGRVATEFAQAAGYGATDYTKVPALQSEDVAEAVRYVVSTPPHVQNISSGRVATEFAQAAGYGVIDFTKLPALQSEDVAEAVRYVVSTPPCVQVHELIVRAVGQTE